MFKSINYDLKTKKVKIIDQRKLPSELCYLEFDKAEQMLYAIKNMLLRGAPLIGVAAAWGVVLAAQNYSYEKGDFKDYFYQSCEAFAQTRPTAINLFWALDRMKAAFAKSCHYSDNIENICLALCNEAQSIMEEDIANNQALAKQGQVLFPPQARVMTICNAGALATAACGTALGVLRAVHSQQGLANVWVLETRPLLQGARLTAWELLQENIPTTLISDSMAAYVMSLGLVDAVIIGADRIASNGDTANKIGSYALALAAKEHNVAFYVAAPSSTFDLSINSGQDIPIEEREALELLELKGVATAPEQVTVFNPAFDITPARYISAIICEKAVFRAPYDLKG